MADPSPALVTGILYGPVASRRLGRSLGVNVLPAGVKVCGFNCNYCQCGWTTELITDEVLERYDWPSPDEIADALRARLSEGKTRGEKIDCVTLSGNGEPTLHPEFLDVVESIILARDETWPGLRVGILSNGATLDRPDVVDGLNLLDDRYMKLDAGTDEQFLNMNSPTIDIGIWDIMQAYKRLRDVVAQSMFAQGRRDNTDEKSVQDWINAIRRVRPKAVHLFTLDREPADPEIRKVSRERLLEIRGQLKEQTGIPAEAF